MARVIAKAQAGRGGALAPVDPRIKYPCYKPLDEFVDLARLKSLDGYVAERIRRHIAAQRDDYFLNEHRLDAATEHRPGVREIWLSRTLPGTTYDYLDLNRTGLWRPTPEAEEFAELSAFVETLPFKARGRVLVIYDDAARPTPAHRDHLNTEVCHDFIWMRTNLRKPLYLLNHATGERAYVESYAAWFDTVNQYHGSDGAEGLTFSFRVDGIFTDEFRALIPKPGYNAAAAPALWACTSH
jgi:hypothetical protein